MKKMGLMATSRISIGAYNNTNDIDRLIVTIRHAIKVLR
jgi:selenocysteine lyase/cysteine desulfurase